MFSPLEFSRYYSNIFSNLFIAIRSEVRTRFSIRHTQLQSSFPNTR
uniref:Uncharacterized protein n=1 Tax=Anguilla anguilla TaxID=7936 RepID=A0A0E9U1F7_ANGAN